MNNKLILASLMTVSAIFMMGMKDVNAETRKDQKGLTYSQFGKYYHVMNSSKNFADKGVASWYGAQSQNHFTSSGERFNMYELTAAHKTLPLETRVLVTNLANGKQVVVRVNDRGPFVGNRIIDLSYAAAKEIGMVGQGLAPVSIKSLT